MLFWSSVSQPAQFLSLALGSRMREIIIRAKLKEGFETGAWTDLLMKKHWASQRLSEPSHLQWRPPAMLLLRAWKILPGVLCTSLSSMRLPQMCQARQVGWSGPLGAPCLVNALGKGKEWREMNGHRAPHVFSCWGNGSAKGCTAQIPSVWWDPSRNHTKLCYGRVEAGSGAACLVEE